MKQRLITTAVQIAIAGRRATVSMRHSFTARRGGMSTIGMDLASGRDRCVRVSFERGDSGELNIIDIREDNQGAP